MVKSMHHLSRKDQKLGFNIHALAFVPCVIAMAIVNLSIGPPWWALWSVAGWSIGLAAHWWFVLGPGGPRSAQRQP